MEQHDIFINNHIYVKEVCVSINDFEKIQTIHIKSTTKYTELSKKDRVTNKWITFEYWRV